ncbi:hypothetical protein N9E71_04005 [Candidatus Pelagibacter sp.]|jgi:hypothetical protein|nr:hypothetical protein [Candidatus Pelagibacter sp.]MDC3280211.1 hypothetical protein [bacterium]|tara:strand:- start:12 stop:281 length:270 start_codon:yes stop_codon:yes gene_type:complete
MKKFLLVLILSLFTSTSLFAEYILEPANCTFKKKTNCGAYLYNNKTGATYFCELEKCKEIMPALEGPTVKAKKAKKSKKSKIPKFKKKN